MISELPEKDGWFGESKKNVKVLIYLQNFLCLINLNACKNF